MPCTLAGVHFLAENSETQMGREMTYKMLVRAISLDTEQELAQLVSESFVVSPTLVFLSIYLVACSWLPSFLHACMLQSIKQISPSCHTAVVSAQALWINIYPRCTAPMLLAKQVTFCCALGYCCPRVGSHDTVLACHPAIGWYQAASLMA